VSVVEGIRTSFSDRVILRTCMYLALALGVALFVMWPRAALEAAVRAGAAPDTFTAVALCFLTCLLLIEARFGAQDVSRDPDVHLQEYVRLTPVPLPRLVGGRAMFALLHTLLLLLLGAPFMAAAVAVGGAGLPDMFRALAVIGTAGLAARMCGLLSLCVFGARRSLRETTLYPVLAAVLVGTFLIAPAASPFPALNSLLKPPAGFPEWLLCSAANLGMATVFGGFSILSLAAVRARAKGGMIMRRNGDE
jgi:hypothetical protein